ncbi:hypothetical protein [Rudanella lutea]|uniref:hypothetical protein n=1 Tax=Rudanella lutea TaxID=451374 RepID=UPI000375A49F|nr:hypothetical protein [Rudanella lutea]
MTERFLKALLERPRRLFLIDSLGACLTVVMLLACLPSLEPYIGMPLPILRLLALPASTFALYSAGCYWLVRSRWQLYLNGIAVANGLYCLITFGLIISYYDLLTRLGVAYFLGEIGVICALIWVERQAVTLYATR